MNRLFILTLLLIILPLSVSSQSDSIVQDSIIQNSAITDSSQVISNSELSVDDIEEDPQLIAYSRFNNIWRFVDFFITLLILYFIYRSGISAKIRKFCQRIPIRFFEVWLYFALFIIAYYILSFPFDFYRGFLVEGEYGFINQTFGEWFKEDILSTLITIVFGIIPVWFVYWLINKRKNWWLYFGIGAIPFMIISIVVAPVFISPMFNDFTPLKDQDLKQEILTLADKAGIEGSDVFQVDASKQTSKINAYVTGLFGSKRIVLYDTMIKNFTTEEIRFVMGHEMGHYVMNHIWIGLFLSSIFIIFSLWLTDKTIHPAIRKLKGKSGVDSLSNYSSLPLLMIYLTVIMFVFQPLTNGVSRFQEHRSDEFGMQISGVSGEDAASAFKKLSQYNLSDPDPHPLVEFWFYSHPALKKRIEYVRSYSNNL